LSGNLIPFYLFLFLGVFDFVIMPRVLLYAWKKKGEIPKTGSKIILSFRISGLIFVLLAFLFKFTNLF